MAGLAIGASAVEYTCDYEDRLIWFADNQTLYDCTMTKGNIDRYDDRDVEDIIGIHEYGESDETVKSLSIKELNHVHMPHGMGKIFKNIISLDVFKVGLRGIHRQDMEQYRKLKYVSFNDNHILKLESDVFKYNPHIEVILLYKNQISTVDFAFDNLKKLRYLDFTKNVCYTGEVKNNMVGVQNMIRQIYNRCA